ncbi:MAG: hypothetical protein KDI72_08350, partial [Xanthomonadales bacterium]|nr:hypothetical protein [Xanthomonadales bacterium]MCB1576002.1 hypothetical protein [Xanthomonadales bacterium]
MKQIHWVLAGFAMAGGFMLAGCVGAANAKPSKSAAAAVMVEDPDYLEFARELNREAGLPEAD